MISVGAECFAFDSGVGNRTVPSVLVAHRCRPRGRRRAGREPGTAEGSRRNGGPVRGSRETNGTARRLLPRWLALPNRSLPPSYHCRRTPAPGPYAPRAGPDRVHLTPAGQRARRARVRGPGSAGFCPVALDHPPAGNNSRRAPHPARGAWGLDEWNHRKWKKLLCERGASAAGNT